MIYDFIRFYQRKKNQLINAPYADCSYKWTGGGVLSNVLDLSKFGNVMLFAYQSDDGSGYLKRETVKEMWTPVEKCLFPGNKKIYYGLGWTIMPAGDNFGCGMSSPLVIGHTGSSVGGTACLTILPLEGKNQPKGVVVSMLCNLENTSMYKTSVEIGQIFCDLLDDM